MSADLSDTLADALADHHYEGRYCACGAVLWNQVVDREAHPRHIAAALAPVVAHMIDDARRDARERIEDDASRIERLVEASSLGTDEAKAARESVSNDAGHALVLAARYLSERDEAGERIATAIEAACIHGRKSRRDVCPYCKDAARIARAGDDQ
jgi:hypothetical protein